MERRSVSGTASKATVPSATSTAVRQTPVERDRIADSGAGRRLRRADDEANRLAAFLDGLDATDLADDPGEHGLKL